MIKQLLYFIFTCSSFCSLGQFNQADDQVEVLESVDTLHVKISNYLNQKVNLTANLNLFKGKEIPLNVVQQYGTDSLFPGERYIAAQQMTLDSNQSVGYIVCVENQTVESSSILFIGLKEDGTLIDQFEIAIHKYIEGSMEETLNAWIFDADQDGDLDICTVNELIDYELPNSYADNISQTHGTFFELQLDSFSTQAIPQEMWRLFTVAP